MKKLVAILLVLVFALSLAACSDAGKLAGTWQHETLYTGSAASITGGTEITFSEQYTFHKDGTVTAEMTEESLAALSDAVWNAVYNHLVSLAEETLTSLAGLFSVSLEELLSVMGHTNALDLYFDLEGLDLADFERNTRGMVTYETKSGTWAFAEDGSLVITFDGESPVTVTAVFADRNTLELYKNGEDTAFDVFTRVK